MRESSDRFRIAARARVQGKFAAYLICAFAFVQSMHVHSAETYPGKPIRLVHGYPGSSTDTNARYVAQKLTDFLGQQVIIEGKPGATGAIAADFVAKSAPDGYTLLVTPSSALGSTPHLRKVPFNTLRDFAPVAPIAQYAFLLAAHPAVPARNARELIALARTRKVALTYSTTAVGSAYHLAGVLFATMAGIELLHVPYGSSGATGMMDLVSGRVDLGLNSPVFLLPQVRAGKLRAIGVTGSQRMSSAPDVPTIAESGLPGYTMVGWQGILAPAGTPREIVAALNAAIQKMMGSADIRKPWEDAGQEVVMATPEQFAATLRTDYERYGKLIQKIGSNIEQ
jgi:tripartite-type tricarboxylate transporter receptor subunit TctC